MLDNVMKFKTRQNTAWEVSEKMLCDEKSKIATKLVQLLKIVMLATEVLSKPSVRQTTSLL